MRRWMMLGAALLAAALSPVRAATLLALDLSQLVSKSDYVVVAKAESQQARRVDKLIVTDVQLRVGRVLKGAVNPGEALVVGVLGGAIGDVGLNVPGEASFPTDRSALVFLRREARSGELAVTGMSQGVMPIEGSGESAMVMPGGRDVELVEHDGDGALQPAPNALMQPQPLMRMLGEIQKLTRSK